MTVRVLGRKTSNNVQKVLWLLDELQVDFNQEDFGGAWGKTRTPEYLALNPNGTVPMLVDNAFALWESNSILRYLATKHAAGLYPIELEQRADVDKWMDWQLGTLSPAFRPIYVEIVREKKPVHALASPIAPLHGMFRLLDRVLKTQSCIAADALTLADIAIGPMVYRWYKLGLAEPATDALAEFLQRLERRPAFARHVMIELE